MGELRSKKKNSKCDFIKIITFTMINDFDHGLEPSVSIVQSF